MVGPYFEVVKLRVIKDNITTDYGINSIFETQTEFLDYLNDVFRINEGWIGNFLLDTDLIDYENIEDFTSIEVVAIILTEYKTETVNGTSFTDPDLIGKILDPRMFLDNQPAQVGYDMTGGGPIDFDDSTGTISNINPGELSYSFRSPVP